MPDRRPDALRLASKSIWRERFTRNFQFFCPMCTTPRKIGMDPRPGQPIHFVQVGLTTLVISLLCVRFLPWIGWKSLVGFVPLWIAFETVYRARIRAKLVCGKCGFDPVLYLVDVDRAREAIRDHWRKRFAERGIPFPGESENDAAYSQPAAPSDGKCRAVSEDLAIEESTSGIP